MRKSLITFSMLSMAVAAAYAERPDVQHGPVEDVSIHGEPPMLGVHLTREAHGANSDHAASNGVKGNSPNMSYHGGKILKTVVTKAIYWGPSWTSPTFAGDKISGLDQFYTQHNASRYAATVNEYTGSNGQVGSSGFLHLGHTIDTSQASSSTSAVLAAVCRNITPDTSGNGYYPVYTDIKRGNAQYCAWHSYGSCGGMPVQFAFFFDLDGDAGCDPRDTPSVTGHSQGLAALANVSGHEVSEARSDPASPGAWYDRQGYENSDKCAWTFASPGYVTLPDGSKWRVQGNWSNGAYSAGTGYPNSSGQKGCISGS
jgi:hypothetical protein